MVRLGRLQSVRITDSLVGLLSGGFFTNPSQMVNRMNRRKFLLTSGSAFVLIVAGCSGGAPETEGDDDDPIDAEPGELLPSADLFGDGWEPNDNEVAALHPVELEGNTASASFANDDDLEGIDVEVTVFDSVDRAMSGYEEMYDADSGGSDDITEEVEIASEGYLIDLDTIVVYFRDANVIGVLQHVLEGSSNSKEYAADWHETWRD